MKSPAELGLLNYPDLPYQNPARLDFLETVHQRITTLVSGVLSLVHAEDDRHSEQTGLLDRSEADNLTTATYDLLKSDELKEWTQALAREKEKPRKVLRTGYRSDGEAARRYWVFPDTINENEAGEILQAFGFHLEPDDNQSAYSPTGRWFYSGVRFQTRKHHLIAVASAYLDC